MTEQRPAEQWVGRPSQAVRVVKRGAVTLVVGAVIVVALAIGFIAYPEAHRDPGGGNTNAGLSQYAELLPTGYRLYWLPSRRVVGRRTTTLLAAVPVGST